MVGLLRVMTTTQQNNYDADNLLITYIEYANEDGIMSDTGLKEMSRLFDKVDLARRADVFQAFLNKLDERHIYYNKAQFNY